MRYVDVPGTKEKVSVIGLGTWVFGGEHWGGADDEGCVEAVRESLGLGMNFIDTAPFYTDGKAEQLVGRGIKGLRDKAFIATKCGLVRENGRIRHDLSPASVSREADASLRRMDCGTIDLYMCHWPDPATPVEVTMDVMLKLRAEKKIRYIGVSNFDLQLLKRVCRVAPVSTLEVQYSLLQREVEAELLPFCRDRGIGVIAYGVLGGGILTGKYARIPSFGKNDARRLFYAHFEGEKLRKAQKIIQEMQVFGRPLNEVALSWVGRQPGVMTALAGCRNVRQVRENAAAADVELPSEDSLRSKSPEN